MLINADSLIKLVLKDDSFSNEEKLITIIQAITTDKDIQAELIELINIKSNFKHSSKSVEEFLENILMNKVFIDEIVTYDELTFGKCHTCNDDNVKYYSFEFTSDLKRFNISKFPCLDKDDKVFINLDYIRNYEN